LLVFSFQILGLRSISKIDIKRVTSKFPLQLTEIKYYYNGTHKYAQNFTTGYDNCGNILGQLCNLPEATSFKTSMNRWLVWFHELQTALARQNNKRNWLIISCFIIN
jgi:hypothetical protein